MPNTYSVLLSELVEEFNLELSALARVFDGMPVQMVAMKYNDMETAVRIGEEFGLNYVLGEA